MTSMTKLTATDFPVWSTLLLEKGCGAYVGEKGCNAPCVPVLVEVNQPMAMWLFRVMWRQDGRCFAVLCASHQSSVSNAIAQANPALLKRQSAEWQKFARQSGLPQSAIDACVPGAIALYSIPGGDLLTPLVEALTSTPSTPNEGC